jgi:hypothetical protein
MEKKDGFWHSEGCQCEICRITGGVPYDKQPFAGIQYLVLRNFLRDLRKSVVVSQDVEAFFADRMDVLWNRMTFEEQQELDPDTGGYELVDVDVKIGESGPPRKWVKKGK